MVLVHTRTESLCNCSTWYTCTVYHSTECCCITEYSEYTQTANTKKRCQACDVRRTLTLTKSDFNAFRRSAAKAPCRSTTKGDTSAIHYHHSSYGSTKVGAQWLMDGKNGTGPCRCHLQSFRKHGHMPPDRVHGSSFRLVPHAWHPRRCCTAFSIWQKTRGIRGVCCVLELGRELS